MLSLNPIVNNRIVSDRTFAIRLLNFIRDVDVNDPASDEEKCYLLNIAQSLLDYQIKTAEDESEIFYLKFNKLL
jgi:hypothetical protein